MTVQMIKQGPDPSPWPTAMKQYKAETAPQSDKQSLIRTILQSCRQTEQFVIFVRANETVQQLQQLVSHAIYMSLHL